MLDLRTKDLQNAIEIDGVAYMLNTDFRVWLDFSDKIARLASSDFDGYQSLFNDIVPMLTEEVFEKLSLFWQPPSILPRDESGGESVMDMELDADFIYSAFLQSYRIDLMTVEMHWHKFCALLSGLPEGTVLSQIIEIRSYKGDDADMLEQRANWSLPLKYSDEERKAMEEFNEFFG